MEKDQSKKYTTISWSNLKNKVFIIGITGGFGSGKSTTASFFEEKGFGKIILSSFLEEEAYRRGFRNITRKILQDIGNEWRKKYGSGILAKKSIEYIKSKKIKIAVIDGIRNIEEIKEFRKKKNFLLLAIVSSKKNRFERLKNLKRREKLTPEIFKELDRRDQGLGQKDAGLHVMACQKLADAVIENNGSVEEFKNKLSRFLKYNS